MASVSQRMRRLAASMAFCALLILLLTGVGFVLRPTPAAVLPWAAVRRTSGEADVLFLGSSRTHCSVLPMELWRRDGITSIDVAAGGQTLQVTRAYLRAALRSQHPSVVMIEVSRTGTRFEDLAQAHSNLDDMPRGLPWLSAVISSQSPRDWFEFLFPLQVYHSRWHGLGQYDFLTDKRMRHAYARGAYYLPEVEPQPGTRTALQISEEGYERDLQHVRDMLAECDAAGVSAVVFTAPSFERPMIGDRPLLAVYESDLRSEFPSVEFLDTNEIVDAVGLDPQSDYKDATHLNHRGALKFTAWMGEYLVAEHGVQSRRQAEFAARWDDDLAKYDEVFRQDW